MIYQRTDARLTSSLQRLSFCDLLLNRRTATWDLIIEQHTTNNLCILKPKITRKGRPRSLSISANDKRTERTNHFADFQQNTAKWVIEEFTVLPNIAQYFNIKPIYTFSLKQQFSTSSGLFAFFPCCIISLAAFSSGFRMVHFSRQSPIISLSQSIVFKRP